MKRAEYSYLRFARFKEIANWSVSHILGMNLGFTDVFPMTPIGQIMERSQNSIEIEDEVRYKQITLKTNGGGAVLRDEKQGKDIGTKKQYVVSTRQFIMSKIDARNGAFGLITEDLDGAVVTADFPVFDVNSEKVVSRYLFLLSSTKAFARFAQSCSRGTTNRQRIDIEMFLSNRIPLPSCETQQSFVDAYDEKIKKARELEQQAKQIGLDIEDYLLTELGINNNYTLPQPTITLACEPQAEYVINQRQNVDMSATYNWGVEIKKEYRFLEFVRFKDVERWDMYNGEPSAISRLKQSCFPLVEIGKAYNFIKRSWDKKEKEFRYVEIGSVDALNGITYAEKTPTSKAPSRATQKIATGDLIIGTTRPYLKKFAIVNEDYNDCVCSSGFQVIEPNETNNISFLYEYLMTAPAIAQFELFMTGALYPAITNKNLKKVLIPLPTLEIQNAIVEHINEEKARIKEMKKQAEELRKEALVEFENEIFE
jgi:restriction endonuclease S subunit